MQADDGQDGCRIGPIEPCVDSREAECNGRDEEHDADREINCEVKRVVPVAIRS